MSLQTAKMERCLAMAAAKPEPKLCDLPPHLDVRRIMLKVVPDGDGDPIEVYAKSIDDVEEEMSRMGQRLEEYELGIRRYSDPAAKPETQGERDRVEALARKHGWSTGSGDPGCECYVCGKFELFDFAAALLSAGPARVEPMTHVGYFNTKYGTFFGLAELAHTKPNTAAIEQGEIVRVFAHGIGKDQA